MAKAIIDFLGKKYTYKFDMPEEQTKHNIALAIAIAKGKKEGVTKYTGLPKDYNLVMELLNHNGRYCFPDGENNIDYLEDANQRNIEEIPVKIICPDCNGLGSIMFLECKKCNGHGYKYERLMWRTGITQSHTHIIDIDSTDKGNMLQVKNFYGGVLNCKFTVIRSKNGYWLFSDKKFKNIREWKYDHCRVLYPSLKENEMDSYIIGLEGLDYDENNKFKKISSDDFKRSRLYQGFGHFDVMFTILSIKRERSTIRTSKKRKDDKIEIIK